MSEEKRFVKTIDILMQPLGSCPGCIGGDLCKETDQCHFPSIQTCNDRWVLPTSTGEPSLPDASGPTPSEGD